MLIPTVLVMLAAFAVYFSSIHPHEHQHPPLLSTNVTDESTLTSFRALLKIVDAKKAILQPCRIATGYNSNLDVIASANKLFSHVGLAAAEDRHDHAELSTLQELQQTYHHYFHLGGAAERFVRTQELFHQLVKAAQSSIESIEHIGGNAALIGHKLAQEGCEVLLGGPVGTRLAALLHADVKYPAPPSETTEDQVHLILEYKAGEMWHATQAPRSNRFILTHDQANSKAQGAEAFHKALKNFHPTGVVISGFHILESLAPAARFERVKEIVAELLREQEDSSAPVHVELASMTDSLYLSLVLDLTLPHLQSLGLNEQELASVYLALGGQNRTVVDELRAQVPPLEDVVAVLTKLFHKYPVTPGKMKSNGVSRIHFHSLAYHLVAQRQDAWPDGTASVAAGAVTATLQACDMTGRDKDVTAAEVAALVSTALPGVSSWRTDEFEFFLAPVAVCRRPTKTVGLGDSISAMGFLYHTH